MNLDVSPVPECVARLANTLEGDGFAVASSFGSGAANWVIDLRRDTCVVRLTVDRGAWWVETGGSRDGLYDPDVWMSCLDGVPVAREPMSLEEQVEFVRARWQ